MVPCELRIARKFPGRADAAQDELNDWCLDALGQGKTVVRLKIGDPFLFGRGGEEVLFFRKHGVWFFPICAWVVRACVIVYTSLACYAAS